MQRNFRVAIVGAGSFASSLAPALRESGYAITEIVSRDAPGSRLRAQRLAVKVGARAATIKTATLNAELLWFCIPDREIRVATVLFSGRSLGKVRFAFHSSGALPASQLGSLRRSGVAIASVHPLMTFVPDSRPSLRGVPFAVEGDAPAVRLARRVVRDLGGDALPLITERKAAYHAWATMTSPLFLAFLVTLEDAAIAAGLTRENSRRKSQPIIRQTLDNYARLGPRQSFSGPIIRGDVETVTRHLAVLRKRSETRDVYVALARSALRRLPVKNRKQLENLLRES